VFGCAENLTGVDFLLLHLRALFLLLIVVECNKRIFAASQNVNIVLQYGCDR